jgi:hypothetical protein
VISREAPRRCWSGFYLGLNGGYGFGESKWISAQSGSFATDAAGYLFNY